MEQKLATFMVYPSGTGSAVSCPLPTSDLLGDGYRKIIAKLPRNLLGPGVNKCPSNTKSRIAGNEVQSPP